MFPIKISGSEKGEKKPINFSSTSKRESTITLSVSCNGLNFGQAFDFYYFKLAEEGIACYSE